MELNTEQLVTYNPKLAKYTPTTRIAYAKFKNVIQSKHPFIEEEEAGNSNDELAHWIKQPIPKLTTSPKFH